MPAVDKMLFPRRIPHQKLQSVYASCDEAFRYKDYLYVARFGHDEPALRGVSLLLLGNRTGGERVLDQHKIHNADTCLYRAYAAWIENDMTSAVRWVKEGLQLAPNDGRFERLNSLMQQQSFRIVIHSDFCLLDAYHNIPGFDVIETRQLKSSGLALLQSQPQTTLDAERTTNRTRYFLPIGHSLASIIPAGPPVDLVLLDDLKLAPVGLQDVGAPVVVNFHDHEWYYEFLKELAPEINLLSVGTSSELIEVGRAFNIPCTTQFFSIPVRMPTFTSINRETMNAKDRDIDILFTGGVTHDFYRDKRQTVLPLATLNPSLSIKIVEGFFSHEDYDKLLRRSRFTISSVRSTNYLSTRTLDSVSAGALNLTEDENAFPYIFSQSFDCFPTFRHDHLKEDIMRHVGNYSNLVAKFVPQIPLLEEEIRSMLPNGDQKRVERYLRHLLFNTKVLLNGSWLEKDRNHSVRRKTVHCNDYNLLKNDPIELKQLIEQTKSPHWLRLALAKGLACKEGLPSLCDTLALGLAEFPQSLMLHYVSGLCMRIINNPTLAEASFGNVVSGKLHLMPMDAFPAEIDSLNGLYWFSDARIREQCQKWVEPLAAVEDVCKSYAYAHLSDLSLEKIFLIQKDNDQTEILNSLHQSSEYAEQSLLHFKGCEAAQRLYLRANYGLAVRGQASSLALFERSFDAAVHNDFMVLQDCGPLAIHLLMLQNRNQEAQRLLNDYLLVLGRAKIDPGKFILYPEVKPILDHYKIPHASGYRPP